MNDNKQIILQAIAVIDQTIKEQVNSILHHPKLQSLEASWRGLHYLVFHEECDTAGKRMKLKYLDLTWHDLAKDLLRAIDFDQSHLFRKVYSQEFDYPGGEPFGLLIGDYYVTHGKANGRHNQDLAILKAMSQVAAAAFVPFVTSADAAFLGLDDFQELSPLLNLERIFQQQEYAQWRNFQKIDDARFIGLVLPKVLMRIPYRAWEKAEVHGSHYLWGNAIYCFAAVVMRSYGDTGWLLDIKGVIQDQLSGGVVTDLTRMPVSTDAPGLISQYATQTCITDKQEKQLSDYGFIPLCECKYTTQAAFYSCQSVQRAKQYSQKTGTKNASLSSRLDYLLCVSRFAHYVKVMARNKIGSFISASECQRMLQQWIVQYTIAGEDLAAKTMAQYPLQRAEVVVQEQAGKPGKYFCIIHLRPHCQLERIESELQLMTELLVA